MGHVPSRFELSSIIRRIDVDGDGKLRLQEFQEGIKSQFTLVNKWGNKASRVNPTRVFMDGKTHVRGYSKIVERPLVEIRLEPPPRANSRGGRGRSSNKPRAKSGMRPSTAGNLRNSKLAHVYGLDREQSIHQIEGRRQSSKVKQRHPYLADPELYGAND